MKEKIVYRPLHIIFCQNLTLSLFQSVRFDTDDVSVVGYGYIIR
jgi:hypothetical protein